VGDAVDLGALLVACVSATETAVSVMDATSPDLPLLYVNPAFERMTGYSAAEAVGRDVGFLHGPATDPDTVRAIADGAEAGRHTRARLVHYRADGTPFWVEVRISPVRDDDGVVTRFVAVHHDVSVEVSAEREAAYAAARDALTGLLNRSAFVAHLERELSRAQRQGGAVGVLFLDVDSFKAVNDTYGHLVGDGYLLHVAECLRQRLRGQDAAARVGGDEFVALLADLPDDGADSAAHVVADLRRALAGPFGVDGVEHTAHVSVGTALFPRDGLTVRDLVACADADMYRGKRPPRGPGAVPAG
jgi:diguanylate cyclase (GGDEF)-like protein/PAS domain S-box-containing protein